MSSVTVAEQREAARRRHPSTRSPVPDRRLADRVAESLGRSGVRWPQVAAAVLAARGRVAVGVDEFAQHVGVEADVLVRIEAGAVPPEALPEPLRRLIG